MGYQLWAFKTLGAQQAMAGSQVDGNGGPRVCPQQLSAAQGTFEGCEFRRKFQGIPGPSRCQCICGVTPGEAALACKRFVSAKKMPFWNNWFPNQPA